MQICGFWSKKVIFWLKQVTFWLKKVIFCGGPQNLRYATAQNIQHMFVIFSNKHYAHFYSICL